MENTCFQSCRTTPYFPLMLPRVISENSTVMWWYRTPLDGLVVKNCRISSIPGSMLTEPAADPTGRRRKFENTPLSAITKVYCWCAVIIQICKVKMKRQGSSYNFQHQNLILHEFNPVYYRPKVKRDFVIYILVFSRFKLYNCPTFKLPFPKK